MLIDDFNTNFGYHIQSSDFRSATNDIMEELGKVVANDRTNFVTLLSDSDIEVSPLDSDARLIELYVNNIGDNKKLALGSSLLVNTNNKVTSFDGEKELNDNNVKIGYKLLHNYFNDEYSNSDADANVGGAAGKVGGGAASGGVVGAIAGAVGSLADFGSKIAANKGASKNAVMDMASKKQDAKTQLIQSVLQQKQAQADIQKEKAKSKKIWLIVGGSVLALAIITGTIIYIKKRRK